MKTRTGARIALGALVTAIAAGAPVTTAAAAATTSPKAVASVLYSNPIDGWLHLVIRTDTPLATKGSLAAFAPDVPVTIGSKDTDAAGLETISSTLHCYDFYAYPRGHREDPGKQVAVSVGKGGSVLSTTLTVQKDSATVARGASIGCRGTTPDTVFLDLNYGPSMEPPRIFFTADAGPYLKGLRWTNWGTARAVGNGTYISACASCGKKVIEPATIVLSKPVFEPDFGARVYQHQKLIKHPRK